MSDELPPLPDEVRALLDAATPPQPPAGFEARVLAKVVATLGWPGGGATGGGESGPSGPPDSANAAGASGAAAGGAVIDSAAGGMGAGAVTLSKGMLTLGAALLLGAGAAGGVVMGRTVFAPEPVPVVVQAPPQPVETSAPPAGPKVEEEGRLPEVKPVTSTQRVEGPKKDVVPKVNGMGARDTELSAERALLEVARTALARGDVAGTLAAVERHAREFPKGRLEEEREVLFIQALVQAGRREEARGRAEAFRARFRDSLMLPAVDAALAP